MPRKQSGKPSTKAPKTEKVGLIHRSDHFSWLAVNQGAVTNGPTHDFSQGSEQCSSVPSDGEHDRSLPRGRHISVHRKTEPRSTSHSSSVYSQSVASSRSGSLSGTSMNTVENIDYPAEQRYPYENDSTPASSYSQLGGFPGDHEACEPRDSVEREDRARKALGAERALYSQLEVSGSDLEMQRRKFREGSKFKAFVANEPHLVSYNIAGRRYFVHEKPQDAASNDYARYLAAIQHEADMGRKGIDPYSDEAGYEGSMTEIPSDFVSAIPKPVFDQLWERCREANPNEPARCPKECAFEIPNRRNEAEWFKVDLKKYRKTEEPKKIRKQKKSKGKKSPVVCEKSATKKGRRGIVERYFCF